MVRQCGATPTTSFSYKGPEACELCLGALSLDVEAQDPTASCRCVHTTMVNFTRHVTYSHSMKTIEKLRLVRTFLSDEKNWIKGAFRKDGACCLSGALRDKTPQDQPYDDVLTVVYEAYAQLSEEMTHEPPYVHGLLICFNDDPKTTHADVLGLLDRAIGLEEKRS